MSKSLLLRKSNIICITKLTLKQYKQTNSFILIPGMLCSLCMKHGTSSSVGKTWIDIPCSTVQRFNFIRYASSITHANTMKAESDLRRSEKSGDIKQSFGKVISV